MNAAERQCAQRTTMRNRWQVRVAHAACGKTLSLDQRPQGRHICHDVLMLRPSGAVLGGHSLRRLRALRALASGYAWFRPAGGAATRP